MPQQGRPPKLSPDQVAELRSIFNDPRIDVTFQELQDRYGVTYLTLRKVKKGLHPYEYETSQEVTANTDTTN